MAPAAFDLQGHRGARGLCPENTLPAFTRALEIGVTTLELDCGITSDRVAVVSHDRRLNPAITRDENGHWLTDAGPAIWHCTLAGLQRYDVGRIDPRSAYAQRFPRQQAIDGTRIPRLSDLFALVRGCGNHSVRFNIETKLSPLAPDEAAPPELFVEVLLETIHHAGMQSRVTIQSFDWRTLRLVQSEAPEIRTSYLTAERGDPFNVAPGSVWTDGYDARDFGGSVPRMIEAAGGTMWSPDRNDLSAERLCEAHALALEVVPWTVNDEAEMRQLIEAGVDGLISDYPDVMVRLVSEASRRHPKQTT